MAKPHSEKAGEAVCDSGERTVLYRALRELYCSRCGKVIREGDLFTRESEPSSGLPLVRRCRECVPFKTGGGLLDALFAKDGAKEAAPDAPSINVNKKVLSRLGPALAASRKRRGDPSG